MSTTPSGATAPPTRHALNLPAGSVRALLALGVLGYLWVLALTGDLTKKTKDISLAFIYLQFLMILILAHFFAAHGHSIGSQVSKRSPLGFPRGSIRFILLVGYLGLAYFLYHAQPTFETPDSSLVLLMLLVLVSAFFIGHVITGIVRFLSRGYLPAWFQDVQAWVALLALFLLGFVVIVRLVINTSLPLEEVLTLEKTEAVLAGLVGFYFGARS
jgi:hypothetical protein